MTKYRTGELVVTELLKGRMSWCVSFGRNIFKFGEKNLVKDMTSAILSDH